MIEYQHRRCGVIPAQADGLGWYNAAPSVLGTGWEPEKLQKPHAINDHLRETPC